TEVALGLCGDVGLHEADCAAGARGRSARTAAGALGERDGGGPSTRAQAVCEKFGCEIRRGGRASVAARVCTTCGCPTENGSICCSRTRRTRTTRSRSSRRRHFEQSLKESRRKAQPRGVGHGPEGLCVLEAGEAWSPAGQEGPEEHESGAQGSDESMTKIVLRVALAVLGRAARCEVPWSSS